MNLSSRDRRALALGVISVAMIFIVRFPVIRWLKSWSDARQIIATARVQVDDFKRRIRRVLGQRERLARIYGPGVNKPLEDLETARVSLYKAVQGVLKSSGFKPTDYQPQPPRPLPNVSGLRIVPLQIRGKCKLPQLAKCLAEARKTETLVIVDRVSATNDAKMTGQLEVTLVLSTLAEWKKAGS